MERLDIFRNTIVDVMTEYAQYLQGSNLPDVRYSVVEDRKNDVYQLMAIGWEKSNRVYNIIFHADIINSHIWIQEDNTEDGFAALLEEKGITKKEMVLAYFPEYHRKYTEYAVA
jgi:XisI protein